VTEPIVGKAEDFAIEVLSEIGSKLRHNALDHVAINDDHLVVEAKELPQLLFYYQAAFCRLNLRAAQAKIRLEQGEANAFVQLRASSAKTGERMPIEEVKARIVLDENVQKLSLEHAELDAKASAVQGILSALRQKGYSLQLVASIRGKESDWLASSFADRFSDHPQREQIVQAFNSLTGCKII
jgi:hypothetical protein